MKNKQFDITSLPSWVNVIYVVAAAIVNVAFFTALNDVTRYSSLGKGIFIGINIGVLLLLILLNLFVAYAVKQKNAKILYTMISVLVVMGFVGCYLTYVTSSVNSSVDNIIKTEGMTQSISTSFVVYDEDKNFEITSLEEIAGKRVAVSSNHTDQTSYILPISELSNHDIEAEYVEYGSGIDQINALVAGDVDVAALPNNYVSLYESNEGYETILANTQVIHTVDDEIFINVDTGGEVDITTEPINVLIVGIDQGYSDREVGAARSDVLMLATFNPISYRVTLTSIARDSYVPIACYADNASDKITHSRITDLQCTIDTVEDLMDVEIDNYIHTNFVGVVAIVEALGGVVVNNPYEFVGQTSNNMRGEYTVWVPAGENVVLNGEQALAFARERHLYTGGDFQRQLNQQAVIEAALNKFMDIRDVNVALDVLNAAGDNFYTNITMDQMITLFNMTMQKFERSPVQEEKFIDIVNNQLTGYRTSVYDAASQTISYIVRLYEGGIEDAQKVIEQNTNLYREITAPKSIRFSINWEFSAPTTIAEYYSEPIIEAETPDIVTNLIGMSLPDVQSWAQSKGITLNVVLADYNSELYSASLAEGAIVAQSVRSGILLSNISEITVTVITHDGAATSSSSSSTESSSSSTVSTSTSSTESTSSTSSASSESTSTTSSDTTSSTTSAAAPSETTVAPAPSETTVAPAPSETTAAPAPSETTAASTAPSETTVAQVDPPVVE